VSKTITLTPRGLMTPEGAQRTGNAADALEKATTEVANLAEQAITDLEQWIGKVDDFDDLKAAIKVRKTATEEFLRAISGNPPMPKGDE
jgi:Fe-S-cluster formation regulator IscX/YfhJ